MNNRMVDPHDSLISFQQALHGERLLLAPVARHHNLFSHADEPSPGTHRLTYARLRDDSKTVIAFVSCIMNGEIDGARCIAVGYAVPQDERNQGRAKHILQDVISDLIVQARRFGEKTIYVEAVVDVTNIASQKVAEAVLKVDREQITDSESKRPAYRYTARYDCRP